MAQYLLDPEIVAELASFRRTRVPAAATHRRVEEYRRAAAERRRHLDGIERDILSAIGRDPDEIKAVRETELVAMRQLAAEDRALQIDASPVTRKVQERSMTARMAAMSHGGRRKPPRPAPQSDSDILVLDPPIFINADDPALQLQVFPALRNTRVKFKAEWERNDSVIDYSALSFVYLWRNPKQRFMLVTAETQLALNGSCELEQGGGYGSSSMTLGVGMSIISDDPKNQLGPRVYTSTGALAQPVDIHADGGGGFGLGEVVGGDPNGVYDLQSGQLLLPPDGVAIFEASLLLSRRNSGDAIIKVDFSSGEFAVSCSGLIVVILS
jgi:hypothetical protein